MSGLNICRNFSTSVSVRALRSVLITDLNHQLGREIGVVAKREEFETTSFTPDSRHNRHVFKKFTPDHSVSIPYFDPNQIQKLHEYIADNEMPEVVFHTASPFVKGISDYTPHKYDSTLKAFHTSYMYDFILSLVKGEEPRRHVLINHFTCGPLVALATSYFDCQKYLANKINQTPNRSATLIQLGTLKNGDEGNPYSSLEVQEVAQAIFNIGTRTEEVPQSIEFLHKEDLERWL